MANQVMNINPVAQPERGSCISESKLITTPKYNRGGYKLKWVSQNYIK